ncbi:MAG: hypothetical protein ACFFHD_10590 [Promethearchaeota archaeon]
MIRGIKRKTTAVESTYRFFQTVDLIISHFKRDADKNKIFEIVRQDMTLKDLLIATATIHIYHNLGIRVQEIIEGDEFTFESIKKLELIEKDIIVEEVNKLLKESLTLEINLLDKIIDIENSFISFLIELGKREDQGYYQEQLIKDIEVKFEQELQEIVLNYPPFFFYDLIGDLMGFTNEIKKEILEESSTLKDITIDLEKRLQLEEKEDKFIELATLARLIKKVRTNFEFKSYKELQIEAMPVRMIKKKVLDFNLNRFPISIPGLNAFIDANHLKKKIIKRIEESLKEKINYEEFEKKILDFLKIEIIKKLKKHPNDFIYFLECLNENNFDEIIYMLNKYGVNNILYLLNIDEDLTEQVRRNMIRYNIKKLDILSLNDIRKKSVIKKVFINKLKLRDYSHILFILEFDDIINKITKDIFFYIMSKILRQLSRIIESYFKVSNDKSLFLLALKKVFETNDSEEWVKIKLEELIIERILNRQEELVIIFNATNQPLLVNGFILGRLMNISLKNGIQELKNNNSLIYENIASLKLKSDLISPVSYCIGYDIIQRFEKFEESRKSEVEKIIEAKEQKKEQEVKKIREEHKLSTLNWIERRITSSLMRINSPGINPNQLYWQKKDTKAAIENIKLHSELKGDPIDLISQYFNFAVEKIKTFNPDINLPDNAKIKNIVNELAEEILAKRNKNIEQKGMLLEGERYEIATKIAQKIGRLLDKALYSKFKNR